mmetsp:Transcript_20426/g.28743  ORF Transcript_20426/g.28743 Transcript_20426/m.28743 type:complete len:114 (+) Transcript_20426:133-474(+)
MGSMGCNAVRRYAGDSGSIIRLPKAIAMFANRACSRSIMIGQPLSQTEMLNIIKKLKNVQHPWNCPHGRPTLRHVKDQLKEFVEDNLITSRQIKYLKLSVLNENASSKSINHL